MTDRPWSRKLAARLRKGLAGMPLALRLSEGLGIAGRRMTGNAEVKGSGVEEESQEARAARIERTYNSFVEVVSQALREQE
jgi:hypothetical protein